MFKSLWREDPQIHICTQTLEKSLYELNENNDVVEKEKDGWKTRLWEWHDVNEHWNYKEEEMVVVEVYSNCESVTLYLNNEKLEEKKLEQFEDHIYKWVVPFKEGEIRAVGTKNNELTEDKILTSGAIQQILLSADKKEISTSTDEVVHIIAQLTDAAGNPVIDREEEIIFDIKGNIEILGIDNGDIESVQPYRSNKVITKNGKCLLILQGKKENLVEITVGNLTSNTLDIQVKNQ